MNKDKLKLLFEQMKYGDRDKAIEEIYNESNNIMKSVAFSILKNYEDTEEVMQNVIIKIYNLEKTALPSDNEYSWLYHITKNETIELLKKEKPDTNINTIYNIEEDDNNIIGIENYNKLIFDLSDKEKEIVALKLIAKLSLQEIAELLEEPIKDVKWKYYKSIYRVESLIKSFVAFIITLTLGMITTTIGNMDVLSIILFIVSTISLIITIIVSIFINKAKTKNTKSKHRFKK